MLHGEKLRPAAEHFPGGLFFGLGESQRSPVGSPRAPRDHAVRAPQLPSQRTQGFTWNHEGFLDVPADTL
jgi:hypothetical protein